MIERSRIQLLPEHLIDQIKAGEIVERAASILKELIENSIDAQATSIEIHIKNNGLDLIHVSDDGIGMFFEELPYAFCRHATSKIDRFEDLYNLHSYGFRGEALASVSAISRVTCLSGPRSELQAGGKIEIHGGHTISHSRTFKNTPGTTFHIKDLFYNTPARLKFIKSHLSEKNSLLRTIHSFILTHPELNFSIKWDREDRDFFPSGSPEIIKERFQKLVFKKKSEGQEVFHFSRQYDGLQLDGYISKSSSKGHAAKGHYLFANQRLFTDRQIHQAILKNLEPLWGVQMSGHYLVELSVPPGELDVNVHPNKTQIKFFKLKEIFSLISGSLKSLCDQNLGPLTTLQKNDFSLEHSFDSSKHGDAQNQIELSYHLKSEDSLSPTFSNIFSIKNGPLISFQQGEAYLIGQEKLINYFFSRTIKSLRDEADITPLLICEPVDWSDKSPTLDSLEQWGLQIEAIFHPEKSYLLRTIPSLLFALPYRDIIKALLQDDFKSLATNPRLLEQIIGLYAIEDLEKNKIAAKLTNQVLTTLLCQ